MSVRKNNPPNSHKAECVAILEILLSLTGHSFFSLSLISSRFPSVCLSHSQNVIAEVDCALATGADPQHPPKPPRVELPLAPSSRQPDSALQKICCFRITVAGSLHTASFLCVCWAAAPPPLTFPFLSNEGNIQVLTVLTASLLCVHVLRLLRSL